MEEYRGYSISQSRSFIGYEVEFIGRGSAHMSLRGMFTSRKIAKQFIDLYLERKEEEIGKNLQRSRSKQIQRRVNLRRQSVNDC